MEIRPGCLARSCTVRLWPSQKSDMCHLRVCGLFPAITFCRSFSLFSSVTVLTPESQQQLLPRWDRCRVSEGNQQGVRDMVGGAMLQRHPMLSSSGGDKGGHRPWSGPATVHLYLTFVGIPNNSFIEVQFTYHVIHPLKCTV